MSEASISKLKSIVAKVRTSETGGTLDSEQSDDTPRGKDETTQADSDTPSQVSTKSKKSKVIISELSQFLSYIMFFLNTLLNRAQYYHSSNQNLQKTKKQKVGPYLNLRKEAQKKQRAPPVMMILKIYQ